MWKSHDSRFCRSGVIVNRLGLPLVVLNGKGVPMRWYIITYLDDEGNEQVIEVKAASEDAAAKFCGIPFDRIVDVELAIGRKSAARK